MDLWVLIGIGLAAAIFLGSGSNGGDGVTTNGSGSTGSADAGGNISIDVTDKIQAIMQAIGRAEGFGIPGKIPTLANNRGDLVLGDIGHGTLGSQKITVFATVEDGDAALAHEISLWINGASKYYNSSMSWAQIGAIYAGPGTPWAANVAAALGVDPNSTLADYLSA
jgi:hypothetical protein